MTDLIKYDPSYNASQSTYLYNYVSFYRGLSERGKKKFLRRVKKFISSKNWEFFFDVGKEKLLVKTLVAASCIQVTWALDDIYIGSYNYVGIHENGIQLKIYKEKLYGTKILKTSGAKSINKKIGAPGAPNALWLDYKVRFAWDKIKEGFIVSDDSKQIGLYEWTRALIMQAKKDNILDDFFSAYYKVWCESARDIMYVVNENEQVPLELYGAKLPLIIQHFFENPEELKKNHPEIYEQTKILLNLDLLEAKEHDYIYANKIKKEKKIKSKNRALIFGVQDKVRKFALPSGLMYAAILQIPFVIFIWFTMARWTYFSFSFWEIYTAIAAIGAFLVYKYYYIKRGITKVASVILFFMGFMPLLYSTMHVVNYLIPASRQVQVIEVSNLDMLNNYLPWTGFTTPHIKKMIVTTKDIKKNDYRIIAEYTTETDIQSFVLLINKDAKVEMYTSTGILGAKIFDGFVITIRK